MWRNWQTHTTQNRAGNHVGSSPTLGTINKKVQTKSVLFCFRFQRVGIEKEWSSFGTVKAGTKRRQKMFSGNKLDNITNNINQILYNLKIDTEIFNIVFCYRKIKLFS